MTVAPEYRVVFESPLLRYAPASWIAFATAEAVHVKGDSISPAMLAHEGTHVKQLRAAGGTVRGWMRWIVMLLQYGYELHPWEREARRVEEKVRRLPATVRRKLFTTR